MSRMKKQVKEHKRILYLVVLLLFGVGIYITGINVLADSTTFHIYYSKNGEKEVIGKYMEQSQLNLIVESDSSPIYSSDIMTWSIDAGGEQFIHLEQPAGAQNAVITAIAPGTAHIRVLIQREVSPGVYQHFNTDCFLTVKLEIDRMTQGNPFFEQVMSEDTPDYGTLILDLNDDSAFEYQLETRWGNINTEFVKFSSSDTKVASVTVDGRVTAEGAGSTLITAVTTDKEYKQIDTIRVIVKPRVSKEANGLSSSYKLTETFTDQNFIYSNAYSSNYLDWKIYNMLVDPSTTIVDTNFNKASDLIELTANEEDGSISINAKAGRYKAQFYAKDLDVNTGLSTAQRPNAPYATATILVNARFKFPTGNLIVGDEFNIYQNSNVADVVNNFNIDISGANFNPDTGVVTFDRQGTVEVYITKHNTSTIPIDGMTSYFTVQVSEGLLNLGTQIVAVGQEVNFRAKMSVSDYVVNYYSTEPRYLSIGLRSGVAKGISEGTCKVKAEVVTNENVLKHYYWEVVVVKNISITLSDSIVEMDVGDKADVTVSYNPDLPDSMSVAWSIADTNIATISDSSNSIVHFTAKEPGETKLILLNKFTDQQYFCTIVVRRRITDITLDKTVITDTITTKNPRPTHKLNATITPSNATVTNLFWESLDTNVCTVDANGLVTLTGPGRTVVYARSPQDHQIYARTEIRANQQIKTLTLKPTSYTMRVGDEFDLSLKSSPDVYIDDIITWSSSNPEIATVKNDGMFGTVKALKPGTTTITVETEYGIRQQCKVTVLQPPNSISFSAQDTTVLVGQSKQLQIAFNPATTTDKDLTFVSSNTAVATVDKDGKVTGVNAGSSGKTSVQIIATSSNGKMATCMVTVIQPVTSFKLNYEKKAVTKGKTFTLRGTFTPSNAVDKGITYRSLDSSIATVSSSGVVKGIRGGSTIIYATSNYTKERLACLVTVQERITTIKLNYSSYKLGLKKSYRLKPKVASNFATNQKLIWTTSNKKIVSVSSKGLLRGLKLGKATITVRATDGSGAYAKCYVQVVRPVTSITLNKTYLKIVEGRTSTLRAYVKPTNATYKTVTWKSSDEDIAMVDSKGKITALKTGTVTITAYAKDNSGKKATCKVTVINEIPTTKIIAPNKEITLIQGESDTIDMVILPRSTTDKISWTSDNSKIVYVNKSTGKVKALRSGTANITITSASGKMATTKVTVIGLNRTKLTMEQYDTYRLYILGSTDRIRWDVSNPKIARVSANGTVSARKKGTTYVTATIRGRKIKCKITVKNIR